MLGARIAGRSLYALVVAYGISVAGTAMSALAIPWLVLSTTGSAGRTGLIGFAEMAPYVAVQVLSGPLVDRVGPQRGAVWGNAGATVLVCAIPVLFSFGGLKFAVLAVLVAFGGAMRGWADTATGPLVPTLAGRGGVPLQRAAALYSGASRIGLLVGAPLAGVVVAAAGAPVAVLVDGVTFGVAAVLIAVFVPGGRSAGPKRQAGYLASLGAGLRFLLADRLLVGLIMLIAVTNLLDQALLSVLIPVWVRDELHQPAALGLLGGASNAGAMVGVVIATVVGPRLPRRLTFSLGYLLGGAPPFLVLAASRSLPVVLVVTAVAGLAGGVLNPVIGAVAYERIPEELQARALGALKASAWIGIPFGSLVGGALTGGAGLVPALLVTGFAMLVTTAAPSVFPVWRQLNVSTVSQGSAAAGR